MKILFFLGRGWGQIWFICFIHQQKTGRQATKDRLCLSTGVFHLQFGYWMSFSLPPPPLFWNGLTFALISSAALRVLSSLMLFLSPQFLLWLLQTWAPCIFFSQPSVLHHLLFFPLFCFFSPFLCHLFFPNLCREESFYCTVPITPIKREVEELNTIDEVSGVVRLEVQEHFCIVPLRSARIPPHTSAVNC